MERKAIYILSLLCCLFCIGISDSLAGGGPLDTISYRKVENLKCFCTYQDSVALIPAYELYCQWDTSEIHPDYHFGVNSFKDTVNLVMSGGQSGSFCMPRIGKTNSNYGIRQRMPHFGVDIHLITGDSVLSAFDGMIRIARRNKSYGNVVIIRHRNGLETIYAHLSKILVKTNQQVRAGDLIGLGGNTGHSFGSHLHFEVRYKGEPVNPNELISFEDHRVLKDTIQLTAKSFELYNKFLAVGYKLPANTVHKGKYIYYMVRKGDTLYGIARRYGKTPAQICKLNNMKMTSVLHPGKIIIAVD